MMQLPELNLARSYKMTTYEIKETEQGDVLTRTDADGTVWFIPMNPANSDYQRYLRWLENPDAEENGTIS